MKKYISVSHISLNKCLRLDFFVSRLRPHHCSSRKQQTKQGVGSDDNNHRDNLHLFLIWNKRNENMKTTKELRCNFIRQGQVELDLTKINHSSWTSKQSDTTTNKCCKRSTEDETWEGFGGFLKSFNNIQYIGTLACHKRPCAFLRKERVRSRQKRQRKGNCKKKKEIEMENRNISETEGVV